MERSERTETHYVAYMLRLRRVDTAAGPVWRVTLDAVDTGEHLSLASPEDLGVYLRRVIGEATATVQGVRTGGDDEERSAATG